MHPVPGRALEDERRLLPVLRDARWLTPEFREEASAAERWLAVLLTRLEATR